MSTSNTRDTNCGCGGAGGCRGACQSALCGIEGAGAAEAYVRPNFFAGQLLTEDDLDQLVRYTTDKLRLRNRHLFGSGVVCGLEVGCHPCGGGQVIVHPGHAIDCCGNDIVVPCPEQLDVNALLRELRIKLRGGWDCGDPCERESAKPAVPKAERQPETRLSNNAPESEREGWDDEQQQPVERGREYCLWVVYDEQRFDLQAPYETDDPCSAVACEPTRIRESYRFELRCPQRDQQPIDLFSRVLACVSEFVSSKQDVSRARALQTKAMSAQAAQSTIAEQPEEHWAITDPASYHSELLQADYALAGHFEQPAEDLEPARVMRDLEHLAGLRLRWQFLDSQTRYDLLQQNPALYQSLASAVTGVLQGANAFGPQWQQDKIAADLERHQARAVTDEIAKWYPLPPPNAEDGIQFAPPDQLRASYEARLLVEDCAYTTTLHARHVEALTDLRDALRRALERRGVITDCSLYDDLERLRLPVAATGKDISDAEVSAFVVAALALGELILRWLRECICGALQPVCPRCEDDGVLLACLRVDECEVLEVCNLERRWVLTSANVRYWLPPLRMLGDVLEKVCCQLPIKLTLGRGDSRDAVKHGKTRVDGQPYKYVAMAQPQAGEWVARMFEGSLLESPAPSMLLSEAGKTWAGQPIAWDDFRSITKDVGGIITSRLGVPDLQLGDRRSKHTIDLVEALATGAGKQQLEQAVSKAVNEAIEGGGIDLGESLRRSAGDNLERIRSERDAAINDGFERFVSAEEGGLREAISPLLDERVELAVGDLRKRVESEVSRRIRDSGLDVRGRELWLNAALDARLAELNLQPEAIRSRTENLTRKILADNNLIGDLLTRRLRDEVDERIGSLGLDPESIDTKLAAKLASALSEAGVRELDSRIETGVRKLLAEEALLGAGFEERLDSRLTELRGESSAAGVDALRKDLSEALKSITSLKGQVTKLNNRIKELSDG